MLNTIKKLKIRKIKSCCTKRLISFKRYNNSLFLKKYNNKNSYLLNNSSNNNNIIQYYSTVSQQQTSTTTTQQNNNQDNKDTNNNDNTNTNNNEKRPFWERFKENVKSINWKFWSKVAVIAPIIFYYFYQRHIRNCFVEDFVDDSISQTQEETKSLIKVGQLSKNEVWDIIKYLKDKYTIDGYINPDELSEIFYNKCNFRMRKWYILCLFRNSKINEEGKIKVRDAIIGLSLLVHDKENPSLILDAAWYAYDPKNENIDFKKSVEFLNNLFISGHVDKYSLVKRVKYFPPKFEFKDPETVIKEYFKSLNLSIENDKITLQQFKQESKSLTKANNLDFWYLRSHKLGFFKKRFEKYSEKLKRLNK